MSSLSPSATAGQLFRRKPEIMSPAGYWPQLHAAIEAGADAIYFGLKHFSARAKVGFSLDELPEVMRTLHSRGVRGYVTFNTLVFEHELAAAAGGIASIARAGADAIIVQDFAVVRLAREIAPGLELHGSTQMSITSAEGVAMAMRQGVARVNLARELSLEEVSAIIAQTGVGVEIFVHGALCVAYSGQCFSSEAWGGRSANRGQCAQACRLPYDMLVDGRLKPLADARYLLSPGDLYTLPMIPQIVRSGVSALKIEGRYKDENYVALTTRAYREAVDRAFDEIETAGRTVDPALQLQLEQVYSRGLGPYFLSGTNHQAVVRGRAPRHRGIRMGQVVKIAAGEVVIEPSEAHQIAPLKAGDGILFDAADWRSPQEQEEGGRVYGVRAKLDGTLALEFGNGALNVERIRIGDGVWRTSDPMTDRAARPFINSSSPVARQRVRVRVKGSAGTPLVTEWSLVARSGEIRSGGVRSGEIQPSDSEAGISVTVESDSVLDEARNRALSVESLTEQFGRLGNTAYELADVVMETSGPVFVPTSVLNGMRRKAVEKLQELQGRMRNMEIRDPAVVLRQQLAEAVKHSPKASGETRPIPGESIESATRHELHLLVRTPEQLDAAIAFRPSSITLDYLDLYGLRPSVEKVKAAGVAVRVASPRILKPGEARIVDFLVSLDCTILVRSAGMLDSLRDKNHAALTGDFSLNAANSLAASLYLELGLSRITPTHDLNADQITDLAERCGAGNLEVIAYQHLPVFHTEHCVFCRFLSSGTSYRDCGRPCEKHRVELRDSSGRAHPVMADVGCRNTVFGAEAQSAGVHLDSWKFAGIRHFRLEFVHESADQVLQIARVYDRALAGEIGTAKLAAEVQSIAPQGSTEGSLFVPNQYLTLPVLQ